MHFEELRDVRTYANKSKSELRALARIRGVRVLHASRDVILKRIGKSFRRQALDDSVLEEMIRDPNCRDEDAQFVRPALSRLDTVHKFTREHLRRILLSRLASARLIEHLPKTMTKVALIEKLVPYLRREVFHVYHLRKCVRRNMCNIRARAWDPRRPSSRFHREFVPSFQHEFMIDLSDE